MLRPERSSAFWSAAIHRRFLGNGQNRRTIPFSREKSGDESPHSKSPKGAWTLNRSTGRLGFHTAAALLIAALAATQPAWALITGGTGNEPLQDPGWPAGAVWIVNHPGRISWWEGPPFGGGQWHAECRGDAKDLNIVLADFAKLDANNKRIIVRDGVGNAFWINPNREAAKKADARIDWTFIVWQPAHWEHLRGMLANHSPTDARDAKLGPPAEIEVYTGGSIRWADVVVPKGLKLIDERLEAHGFKPSDGTVLEGKVTDLITGKLLAARTRLVRIAPQKKGGYRYTVIAEAPTDKIGHWVLKNAPPDWCQVLVDADGYVPRLAGYSLSDGQPRWHFFDCRLSRPAPVSGRVVDNHDKPLADVEVRLDDVAAPEDGRYESPGGYTRRTDADGRFRFDLVPQGTARVWVRKQGYCRPGLGPTIAMPAKDLLLAMRPSSQIVVTVDFSWATRPEAYIVNIEPEGGSRVGTWGGSGHIDAKNQISFNDVPPGRYVLIGSPNPTTDKQKTDPTVVDLKGGETLKIKLSAK
jgi:hypothetical protein